MTGTLFVIARLEVASASRLKWIRVLTAAFGLLALAAAYAAGAASDLTAADGFARTTMTLVPVVLILVPLAAIVLGVSGHAAEAGSEGFLFAQPLARSTVVIGRWLGQAVVLGGAVIGGLGIGGVWIALSAGPAGAAGFVFFTAASAVLGVIFLAIAAAIASGSETRVTALGAGVFAWFFFVLLYDAAVLSLARWITGSLGGRVLFGSVFANPADVIRVAILSIAGTPNVLGAAGDAWLRFAGGPLTAALLATGTLAAWTAAPLAVATYLFNRRDL